MHTLRSSLRPFVIGHSSFGIKAIVALALAGLLLAGCTTPATKPISAPSGAATKAAAAVPALPKPKIHVLATGGTISGASPDRMALSGYKAGSFTIAQMLADVPEVNDLATVTSEQFRNVGSGDIGSTDILALSQRIQKLVTEQPDITGFVVTHGTGTLEQTAYFLHLTVRTDKPIVVVGAMRPWSAFGTDAHLNLYNAVRVAAHTESRGKGALIVLNDEINSAREGTKTDTLRVDTFNSREAGFLGYADPDKVSFYRVPEQRHTFKSEFVIDKVDVLPQVDIVYGYQDASAAPVAALIADGAKGIVAASGSPKLSAALKKAAADGVKIVSSDSKGQGRVLNSANRLKDGLISSDNLRPQKARILLQVALACGIDSPEELQRIFNQY
jgi:L-asparaginase